MKSFLIALLVLAPLAATAASPEEAYLAARDQFVAKFTAVGNAGNLDEEDVENHQRARDELGRLLQPIIGRVAIKGFEARPRINLDSLFKGDQGFGLLDGLLYSSADDKTHIIVTTDALLAHWLKEHKDWWGPKVANVPQDVDAALKSEAFYTQALMTDAAIVKFLELPLARPAKATIALAMLVARSQDGPGTPDELIVSVVQGGRVFVVSAPANTKINPMPSCEEIRNAFQQRATGLREARAASEPDGENRSERAERIEREGDDAFRRCFAQGAKGQAFYAALTKRAQRLLGLLPSR
jgi:hypothetical protein